MSSLIAALVEPPQLPNGGEGLKVKELFAMLVDYTSLSCLRSTARISQNKRWIKF